MSNRDRAGTLHLRKGAAAWRKVEGETVVYHFASSSYLATNRSGTVLWEAMAEGATREELVQRLVSTFGIEENQAWEAVDSFVDACRRRNLLSE